MGALRQPLASANPSQLLLDKSPNQFWEEQCSERNYVRFPLGYQTTLYRATRGNAIAIAITGIIVELTHGQMPKRSGARPEWTKPLTTKFFADALKVEMRSVQLVLNQLCAEGSGVLARREEPGRGAFSYQAQAWLWEALAAAADSGSNPKPAPTSDDTSEQKAKPTFVTNEPIVVFAGKRPRSLKLSDAVREQLPTIRSFRFDAGGANLSFTSRIDAGELFISASVVAALTEAKNFSPSLPETKELAQTRNENSLQARSNPERAPLSTKAKNFSPSTVTQLKNAIDERFLGSIGEGIDATKLNETARALGDHPAAFQLLLKALDSKARKIVANGNYGLLPRLAEAACEAARTLPVAAPQGRDESPGHAELQALLLERVGCSVAEYRQITGRRDATVDDFLAADEALRRDWEAGRVT